MYCLEERARKETFGSLDYAPRCNDLHLSKNSINSNHSGRISPSRTNLSLRALSPLEIAPQSVGPNISGPPKPPRMQDFSTNISNKKVLIFVFS